MLKIFRESYCGSPLNVRIRSVLGLLGFPPTPATHTATLSLASSPCHTINDKDRREGRTTASGQYHSRYDRVREKRENHLVTNNAAGASHQTPGVLFTSTLPPGTVHSRPRILVMSLPVCRNPRGPLVFLGLRHERLDELSVVGQSVALGGHPSSSRQDEPPVARLFVVSDNLTHSTTNLPNFRPWHRVLP